MSRHACRRGVTVAACAAALALAADVRPQSRIVAGVVESGGGGLRFPDGTLQQRAAIGDARVVVVAEGGGDFTSVQAAIDSILDAGASNRYLVRIAPGVYSEQVTMKSWVDLEGSGELTTRIVSAETPTLVCADHTGIRGLSVVGAAADGDTVRCDGASPRLEGVTVEVRGPTGTCTGVRSMAGAAPTLRQVTVIEDSTCVSVYGLLNESASPIAERLRIALLGPGFRVGIRGAIEGSPEFRHLAIEIPSAATAYGVWNNGDLVSEFRDLEIRLGGTGTGAGFRKTGGGVAVVREARITLEPGFSVAQGVWVTSFGSMRLERSTLRVESGDGMQGLGVSLSAATGFRLSDTEIEVGGLGANVGIRSDRSPFEVRRAGVRVRSPADAYGLDLTASFGSWTVVVDGSSVLADDAVVRADAEYTVSIGSTRLGGAAVEANGGTVTCAGAWSGDYQLLSSDCAVPP